MFQDLWMKALVWYWTRRASRFQEGSVIEVRHVVPSGQTYTKTQYADDSTLPAIGRLSNQRVLIAVARMAKVYRFSDTETPPIGETFGVEGYISPVLQAALSRMTSSSVRLLLGELEPGQENPLLFEWKMECVRKHLDWIEANGEPDLSRAALRTKRAEFYRTTAPKRRPLLSSIALSALACSVLPFIAAFLGGGFGVRELEGRRLDGTLAGLARDLGMWPAFLVLFAAGFPPLAIIASRWQGWDYFRENWLAVALAWACSVTIWMFWMPWSAADSAAGVVWGGVMGTLYPLLNWAVLTAGVAVLRDLQAAHEP